MNAQKTLLLYAIPFTALFIIITAKVFIPVGIFQHILLFISLNILFIVLLYHLVKVRIKNNKNMLFLILVIAIFFKIVLMLVMHQTIIFPDELNTYDSFSWEYARIWRGENIVPINNFNNIHDVKYYFYFVSAIYYVFGHSIIIAKLFNVFFSVLGGFLVYLATKEIFDDELISMIALNLSLFFPFTVFWTLPLLRDGFNLFFMTLSLFLSIRFIKTYKLRYVFFLLLSGIVLFNTRYYIAIILTIAIVMQIFLAALAKKRLRRIIAAGVTIFIVSTMLIFVPGLIEKNNGSFTLNIKYPMLEYLHFEYLNHQRQNTAVGNYAFLSGGDISTFKKAAVFLPKGLVYFFFAPFPWAAKNIKELVFFPDTLLWYSLLPFIVLGIFIASRKKNVIGCSAILICSLLVILLYSFIDGNIWLLHRHRTQATYFLLIFGAVGLSYFINLLGPKIKLVLHEKHKSI